MPSHHVMLTHMLLLLLLILVSLSYTSQSSLTQLEQNVTPKIKILEHFPTHNHLTNCSKTTLRCILATSSIEKVRVWWSFGDDKNVVNLTSTSISQTSPYEWQLSLDCVTVEQAGVYTCKAFLENETNQVDSKDAVINVYVPVSITVIPENGVIRNSLDSNNIILTCRVIAFPKANINWAQWRNSDSSSSSSNNKELIQIQMPNERINVIYNEVNITTQEGSLIINELSQEDNGTYVCQAQNEYNQSSAIIELVVIESPQISIYHAEALSPQSVVLHWRFIKGKDGDSDQVDKILVQMKNYSDPTANNSDWTEISQDEIETTGNKSVFIRNLLPGALYGFQIGAANGAGQSNWSTINITMPSQVPQIITNIRILATTNETLLFGWKSPSDGGKPIIDYEMKLKALKESKEIPETMNIKNGTQNLRRNYMYIFVGLQPATQYSFQVRACSQLGCGNWSQPPIQTFTGDGHAEPPKNVKLTCYFDTTKNTNYALINWVSTDNARGTIVGYNVTLDGVAVYKSQNNQLVTDYFTEWHEIKNNRTHELTAIPLIANTNYSVRICTINLGGCGVWSNNESETTRCSLPPMPPKEIPEFKLERTQSPNQLKLIMPKISQRMGIITCYRMYLIRLPFWAKVSDLPKDITLLNVTSYEQVHFQYDHHQPGVYLADEINYDNSTYEVILGDKKYSICKVRPSLSQKDTKSKSPNVWAKRITNASVSTPLEVETVEDGPLEELSNYSGFIEIQVLGSNGEILRKSSTYLPAIQTSIPPPPAIVQNDAIEVSPLLSSISSPITTIILCLVIGFSLILLVVLLILLIRKGYGVTRRSVHIDASESDSASSKKKPNSNHSRKLNGYLPVKPLPLVNNSQFNRPIHVAELMHIYKERHANNDRIFEQEFTSVPLEFPDRTTHICDLEVNQTKNRFSTIKCYDLTRVRLSLIDQLQPNASDYINANFISINDKLYICTQGPTLDTENDFWRMIYEYECSVVVMLTSCQEQGRNKCAQYWSDEGVKLVDDFSVHTNSIRDHSDFIVRRFNLIPNKNKQESREILHFQFVLWSDFGTPEIPSRILRFIKHVNENYCSDRGPMVVHCCAGIGRAGTYIAIDSILSEINSGFLNIYDRVANLRHQRYHLVQNVKQYVFIYRTMLEFAVFGDTEVDIDHYQDYYHQVFEKQYECNILNEQFNRVQLLIDDLKSCDIGMLADNVNRNRSNYVIPYDANRIILQTNSNEESSYINASLILGYERQLLFIATQDPMESIVGDFWCMIYEQSVSQIVMLSHNNSAQHQYYRYWPNDYETIMTVKSYSIKLVEENTTHSNSNYFTKRRFQIMRSVCPPNTVIDQSPHFVTQYQFIPWHGDHIVPESAIPLITLCEQVLSSHENDKSLTPIVIHCHDGAQRSGVCLSLISLLQQIKLDKRVDIFQTARCFSLQRRGILQSVDQYAFLYRSIMNYIKHRNLGDTGDVVL